MNYESLILLAQTLHEIDEKGSGDLIGITDHKLTIITSIQDKMHQKDSLIKES
jgi:hypothetical protein